MGGAKRRPRVPPSRVGAAAAGAPTTTTTTTAAGAQVGREEDEDEFLSLSSRSRADYEHGDGGASASASLSASSGASSGRRRRRRLRRRGGGGGYAPLDPSRGYGPSQEDAEGEEDDHRDDAVASSQDSEASFASHSTAEAAGRLCDDAAVGVGGAGADMYAVQDAGIYRMLHDECSYLCGTVRSSRSDGGGDDADADADTGGIVEGVTIVKWADAARHTSVTAGAACDLAVMISSKKNRSALIRTSGRGGALSSLLDALACAPEAPGAVADFEAVLWPDGPAGAEDDGGTEDEFAWSPLPGEVAAKAKALEAAPPRGGGRQQPSRPPKRGRGRTKTGRMRRGAGDEIAASATATPTGAAAHIPSGPASLRTPSRHGAKPGKYDPTASHALSVVAHFLSVDCTKSRHSASASPRAARKLRRTMLRHGGAMKGIAGMVLMDPLVRAILEDASASVVGQGEGAEYNEGGPSQGTSQESLPSQDSVDEDEPTPKGSRKRRRLDDADPSAAAAATPEDASSKDEESEERRWQRQRQSTPDDAAAVCDPTKSGRRSRIKGKKRRKMMLQTSQQQRRRLETSLEAIPEDGAGAAAAAGREKADRRVEAGASKEKMNVTPTSGASSSTGGTPSSAPDSTEDPGAPPPPPKPRTPHTLDFYSDGTPCHASTPTVEEEEGPPPGGARPEEEARAGRRTAPREPGPDRFQSKIRQATERIVLGDPDADARSVGGAGRDGDGAAADCRRCRGGSAGVGGAKGGSGADDDPPVPPPSAGRLALLALNRIMTGKDCGGGDEEEEEDDDDDDEGASDENDSTDEGDAADGAELSRSQDGALSLGSAAEGGGIEVGANMSNPLVFTNVMLRRSGSLPLLARATAETAAAIARLLEHRGADGGGGERKEEDRSRGGGGDKRPRVGGGKGEQSEGSCCLVCLRRLRDRLSELASVVDWACCLSSENRRVLCSGTFGDHGGTSPITSDGVWQRGNGGLLISSLLRLATAVPLDMEMSSPEAAEIVLLTMRTLTSLTHENNVAGAQLLARYGVACESKVGKQHLSIAGACCEGGGGNSNRSTTAISVVFHLLHRTVKVQQRMRRVGGAAARYGAANRVDRADKSLTHCYDVITFCLNVFANVLHLETSTSREARRLMAELSLTETDDVLGAEEKKALSWLSSWVVSQTESYRDAVMKGSFGKKDGDNRSIEPAPSRDLEKHEEDYLITAGHGFIVLACLMREAERDVASGGRNIDSFLEDKRLTLHIRNAVLDEMPRDEHGVSVGVTLIIKTLKAFCNFYHYSVGALSVAVVTPVVRLIAELERM